MWLLGHIHAKPRGPHSVRVSMIGDTSLAEGPRARDVGLATLHLDHMGESWFQHVGLTTLHVTCTSEAVAAPTYLLSFLVGLHSQLTNLLVCLVTSRLA